MILGTFYVILGIFCFLGSSVLGYPKIFGSYLPILGFNSTFWGPTFNLTDPRFF